MIYKKDRNADEIYFCPFFAIHESEHLKKENKTVFMNFIGFKHKTLKN